MSYGRYRSHRDTAPPPAPSLKRSFPSANFKKVMMTPAPVKPPMFLGRNIFSNDEYEEVAHTQEQLEELENGEVNNNMIEHEGLVDNDTEMIGARTHRLTRISCMKRYVRCMLTTACIATILAVGVVTARHLYYLKYSSFNSYSVRVDALCSPTAVSSVEGLARCRDACTVASCCVASKDDEEENCFNTFPTFCQEYLSCIILHPGKNVLSLTLPPAPKDLEATCNFLETAISSPVISKTQQLENCEEACDQAWCCFPSAAEHNCYTSNIDTCNGYASCSRVRSEVVGLPDTAKPLSPREEACQRQFLEDPNTKQICQALCESFSCCFVPDSSGNMCDSDPKCAELAPPCAILYTAQGTEEEDINPDLGLRGKISLSCNPDHFPSTFSACQELCSGSICCFRAESCELPETCETYGPCKILYGDLLDIPQQNQQDTTSMSRSPVSEACQPDLLENAESRQICKDLCQSFTCCFVPDPYTGITCYDSDPNCSNWGAPCGNLFNLEISQGINPYVEAEQNMILQDQLHKSGLSESIEEACDFNHFPESRSECDELCSVAACCFESRKNCDMADQCERTYGPCKVLYDDFFEEPGASDKLDINGGVITVAQVEKNVYDACIGSDLSQQEQLKACATVCEPATCCFLEGEETCKGERLCDSFVQCKILLNLSTSATSEPASYASDNTTETTKGMVAGGQDGGYDVVFINGNTFTKHEIEKDVHMKCIENDLSIKENLVVCEAMCESGNCCFTDDENSCQSLGFCDAFVECNVLSSFKEGTLPSENPFAHQETVISPQNSEPGQDSVMAADQSSTVDQDTVLGQTSSAEGMSSSSTDSTSSESSALPSESPEAETTKPQISDVEQENGTVAQNPAGGQNSEVSPISNENEINDLLGETNTLTERGSDSVDELDKYNTATLLNALNELDASPSDAAPAQNSAEKNNLSINEQNTADSLNTNSEVGAATEKFSGPGSVAEKTVDQFPLVDQIAVEDHPEQLDSEEIFIQGERYSKDDLRQQLQAACSDMSSDDNRRACIALCEPAECCNEESENSCKGEPFCDLFASCSALINDQKNTNALDNGKVFIVNGHKYTEAELERRVRDKCALKDLSIQENREACTDLCKLGKCCFKSGDKSCKGDAFCNAFGDCKELIL
jgi:hypothetical protein